MPETEASQIENRLPKRTFSLRELLALTTVCVLVISQFWTSRQLYQAHQELRQLREEIGYISETDQSKLVAVRVHSDEPLTWKLRVRVPQDHPYGVAFATQWQAGASEPDWRSIEPLPSGESEVILRLIRDPRDNRWKIITLVRHDDNTRRVGSPLSDRQAELFQQSCDTLRGGIKGQVSVAGGRPLRVIDEKWFSGEGGLMLFGSAAPKDNIDGVFAELKARGN